MLEKNGVLFVSIWKMKGRQEGKEMKSVGKLQDDTEYFFLRRQALRFFSDKFGIKSYFPRKTPFYIAYQKILGCFRSHESIPVTFSHCQREAAREVWGPKLGLPEIGSKGGVGHPPPFWVGPRHRQDGSTMENKIQSTSPRVSNRVGSFVEFK